MGYGESEDGSARPGASNAVFAPPEMKMFDFCVRGNEEITHLKGNFLTSLSKGRHAAAPRPACWWCRAKTPAGALADWSQPIQIMHG